MVLPAPRSTSIPALTTLVRAAAIATCCCSGIAGYAQESGQTAASAVDRGGYLVRAGGCADCHTPLKPGPEGPVPDLSRGLSGHPQGLMLHAPDAPAQGPWAWGGSSSNTAFWGPWGVSYAANLTPDATGLGAWTAEHFIHAMRTGRHAGNGRPIAPPMPWQSIGQYNDADLHAIFAYLRAQPPIRNAVPAYQPPAVAKR